MSRVAIHCHDATGNAAFRRLPPPIHPPRLSVSVAEHRERARGEYDPAKRRGAAFCRSFRDSWAPRPARYASCRETRARHKRKTLSHSIGGGWRCRIGPFCRARRRRTRHRWRLPRRAQPPEPRPAHAGPRPHSSQTKTAHTPRRPVQRTAVFLATIVQLAAATDKGDGTCEETEGSTDPAVAAHLSRGRHCEYDAAGLE
jgi:hypothetical protein